MLAPVKVQPVIGRVVLSFFQKVVCGGREVELVLTAK
jgi:hypothetical protein